MIKLKDILGEVVDTDLVNQWKKTVSPAELKYFCVRDNCGPAAIDFMQFLTKKGIQGLKRVRGFFLADEVVSDKKDFTSQMKTEFLQDGGDWDNKLDRKKWIENSKYEKQWKYIPHFWVEDSRGNIYDAVGEEQFIKTKLAKDLNPNRYKLTDNI